MKKLLFSLALGALLATSPRIAKADVSVDFFYNNLSGGSWIETDDYGYCWQPDVAVSNTSWRPYADGYWAYTDQGWTWVSYEDFGWATYHYGRWAMLSDYGWVWVPGRDADLEWGPAWVSWRTGGEYIGWAPLPPETLTVYESHPLSGHLDVEFNIGPAYYNFVDVRYIGEPVLRERIIAPTQNITYIQQTVNVTNITYKNKTVYNYGPDVNVVNRVSTRPVQRLRLDREQNADVSAAAKSGGLTKVQGDRLVVAAPARIARSARQVAPPSVKTKVGAAKVDRGWSGVGNEQAQTEFKQKLKSQNREAVAPLGTGAAAQTNASGNPAGASATASPNGAVAGASPGATAATASPTQNAATDRTGRGRAAAAAAAGAATGAAINQANQDDEHSVNPHQGQGQGQGEQQGRRGQRGRQMYAQPTQPPAGTGAAANEAATATGDQARGQGAAARQGRRDRFEGAGSDQAAQSGQGQGYGRGQGRQGGRMQNSAADNPPPNGDVSPGQGRQGRRLPNQATENGPGGGVEGQRGGGRGQGRREGVNQPGAGESRHGQGQAQGEAPTQGQGQGQAQGQAQDQTQGQGRGSHGGKPGEASPAPTPQ